VRYRYDPELAAALELQRTASIEDLEAARALHRQLSASADTEVEGIDSLEISDHVVPAGAEGPELRVRVYAPLGYERPLPGVLYFHSGGFVLGSIEAEHARAAWLALSVGAVLVSVEYRLAPEHPYPAALDDCYAALCWTASSAATLGVDPTRIGVAGASSGGNLAAAIALLARDRGEPRVAFQCLVYPTLDDRMQTASVEFVGTPMIDGSDVARCWGYYLGPDRTSVSPYAAPGREDNLAGLPPTYVMTAELDPLRDDGLRYAARLLEAGVSVELHQFGGAFHGFDLFPTAVSRRALDEQVAWVVGVTRTTS
jgi:acetyl esterase